MKAWTRSVPEFYNLFDVVVLGKKKQCLESRRTLSQRSPGGTLGGFPLFSCSAALKDSVRLIGLDEYICTYLHTKDTFPSGHLSCACSCFGPAYFISSPPAQALLLPVFKALLQ